MSKQVGVIKLKGNLGGVSFYRSEGTHLARMASGPDKERISNDASFQRTRENNMEFGGCAKASKAFRSALSPVQYMSDARLASRLTQIFKSINLKGDGIRGQRPITVTEHGNMLVNLEFNINRSFSSLLTAPIVASNAVDRRSASIRLSNILPNKVIKAPAGATHFGLVHAIGMMSDFSYNDSTRAYEPVDAVLNGIGAVSYGEYTAINAANNVTLELAVEFPTDLVLNENVSVIQCVGIEFYQLTNGQYYPLFQSSAMKVVRVF